MAEYTAICMPRLQLSLILSSSQTTLLLYSSGDTEREDRKCYSKMAAILIAISECETCLLLVVATTKINIIHMI